MRPVSLLLILSLLITVPAQAKSDPLKSIRQYTVTVLNEETGERINVGVCTAWATLYKQQRVWVTAMHCVPRTEEGDLVSSAEYTIDGKKVAWKAGWDDVDLALFTGGPSASPLLVGQIVPALLSDIWTAGFPLHEGLVAVKGSLASQHGALDGLAIYQLPAAQGLSGAPVLNKDGIVIGTVTRMNCPYLTLWCPISSGQPMEVLEDVFRR